MKLLLMLKKLIWTTIVSAVIFAIAALDHEQFRLGAARRKRSDDLPVRCKRRRQVEGGVRRAGIVVQGKVHGPATVRHFQI